MNKLVCMVSCLLCLLLHTTSIRTVTAEAQETDAVFTKAYDFSSAIDQASEHGCKIESKYDGFNHETVVALKKMRVNCVGAKGFESTMKDTCVSVAASLHAPGMQLDYVRYAKLQLIFETKDWDRRHPLDQRELIVVADGETLKLGKMGLVKQDLDSDRLLDVMKEVLEVSIPYQTFNKIAHAEIVEIKVGNTMFELRERTWLLCAISITE